MSEDEVIRDPEAVISALIELNQQNVLASRKLAQDAVRVRNAHLEAAELCDTIAKMLGESARVAADAMADIIASEWGLNLDEDDDDPEPDESVPEED